MSKNVDCPKNFSVFAPGRTEIAGNHVDHQHGVAVTGTLKQGIYGEVELRDDYIINVNSKGFEPFEIDLKAFKKNMKPNPLEFNSTSALVKGVCHKFLENGIKIKGFNLKCKSTIGSGMGLSSSAAFELMIAVILNDAYAKGKFSKMELAQFSQFAEVEYYGKPCGLLDQTAIAYGGIIKIDFANVEKLKVMPIDFSFKDAGLAAILVDSGFEHGDISHMYASIPEDMNKVSRLCNVEFLNEINTSILFANLHNAEKIVGDKALVRAIHYFHEIDLTNARIKAMEDNDSQLFMYLHGLSGSSSAQFLQNVALNDSYQKATFCQAVCELCLDHCCAGNFVKRGASRIHGGGFGGCIQVFLPIEQVDTFRWLVNNIYSNDVAQEIQFSSKGAHTFTDK